MKKKIIFGCLSLGLVLNFSACARIFPTYVPDGNGGSYRFGKKWIFPFFIFDHAEHCKAEPAGNLRCEEIDLDVNLSG